MNIKLSISALCALWCLVGVSPDLWGQEVQGGEHHKVGEGEDRYVQLIDSSFHVGGSGDYAGAERYLMEAIALSPSHPLTSMLLNNLGGVQQLQGKTGLALHSFSRALERDPDNATIRFNRARLYALVGEHRKAVTDYSLLVAKYPTSELYRYQRAMSYMLTGEYDLADLDLTSIIESNPETLKARIGYALLETLRKRWDEAERLYGYLLERLPRSSEVYEGRARMYLARGMKGFAQRDVERAVEYAGLRPSASLYRLVAEVARALGDDAKAIRAEKQATELEAQILL